MARDRRSRSPKTPLLAPNIIQRVVLLARRDEHQVRVCRRGPGEPLARGPVELGAVPAAHELAVLALERAAEMQARVGGRSDPFAGPIDMQFTPEVRYQDGPLDGDIGNLAEGV